MTRAGAVGNLPWVRGTSQPGVRMAPRGAQHKEAINAELAAEATKIGGKQFIQKYGLATWTAINSIDTQNQEFEKNIKDIDEGKDKEEVSTELSTKVKEEPPKLPEEEPEGPGIGTELATEAAIQSKKLLEDKELDVSQQTKNLISKIKNKITTWEDHFSTIEEATKAAEDVGVTLREFEEGVIHKKITFRKTGDGFVILFDRKVVGELVDITQFKQEDNTQIGNTRSYQMSVINEDGTKGEPYDTFDGEKNAKDFAKDDVAKALLTETKDPAYPSLRDIFQNLEYNKKGEPKAIAEKLERFRKELAEREKNK
jgi:hypothetical protein